MIHAHCEWQEFDHHTTIYYLVRNLTMDFNIASLIRQVLLCNDSQNTLPTLSVNSSEKKQTLHLESELKTV